MQPVTPSRTFIKLEEGVGNGEWGEMYFLPTPHSPLPRPSLLALFEDLEIDQSALDFFKRDPRRFGIDQVDTRLSAFLNLFTPFCGNQNLAVFAVNRKSLCFLVVLNISHLTPPSLYKVY